MIKTYQKIFCPFKRDLEGSREVLWGVWQNDTIEYLKYLPWTFTEKIDGTNIRIYWDGYKISFAGRVETSEIPKYLLDYLNETFNNPIVEELFEQSFGSREVILFGEGYGPKIQDVGAKYRDSLSFILFDVMINGNYQSRNTVEQIAKIFNIDVVPIVMTGTIYEAIKYVMSQPKSIIAKDKDLFMEGLVGKPQLELQDRCGNRVITKIKWHDFKDFVGKVNLDYMTDSKFTHICKSEAKPYPDSFTIFAYVISVDDENNTVTIDRFQKFGAVHVGKITISKEDFDRYYKKINA